MHPTQRKETILNRFIVTLGLLVFLLAACAPASVATEAPAPATPETEAPVATTEEAPAATEPAAAVTPRGDALEATDPATVQLASGQVQLVEFFAFW